jgi:hypothetical protein
MSDYSARAVKAWKTRKIKSAFIKVRASEAASKEALNVYLEERGWKVVFFEGKTGSPRTGSSTHSRIGLLVRTPINWT